MLGKWLLLARLATKSAKSAFVWRNSIIDRSAAVVVAHNDRTIGRFRHTWIESSHRQFPLSICVMKRVENVLLALYDNSGQSYKASLMVRILKMRRPRPLFRLFSVFSNKQYKFYNKSMLKNVQVSIQYTAPGFEPTTSRTWVFTHNH